MPEHPVASARGVNKVYSSGSARTRALENVNFEVYGGEFVLLEGPSGSGKTTLLSILGCILKASSGRISIRGRDLSDVAETDLPAVRLRHIGFVFQSFNLLPALSARENVQMPLELKGASPKQGRLKAAEMLEAAGLGSKLDALPGELSGGEQQRVALARALVGDPDLILADEPTAALDAPNGRAVMELLHRFGRRKERSVVVVSHDPRLEEFADRVVRLEDGRVV